MVATTRGGYWEGFHRPECPIVCTHRYGYGEGHVRVHRSRQHCSECTGQTVRVYCLVCIQSRSESQVAVMTITTQGT